jgi:hypothetical protein
VTESVVLLPDPGIGVMPEYRAYQVGLDGRIVGFEPMVCADDSEATERARRLVNGHDVELWSGERLVSTLKHKPQSKPS